MTDCIGVFDSGLGGLSALKELKVCLPDENLIYFGDTGRVPYGTRSDDTIKKYVKGDINFMNTFNVKCILIACGTASSIALPHIKNEAKTPTFGVITPAAIAAARGSKLRRIGIIGTNSTIKSGAYERELKRIDSEISCISVPCPLFVPLVENGRFLKGDPVTKLVAEQYLEKIKEFGVDTLILGCTHYPLLKDIIGEVMGENVTLIDPGFESAHTLKAYLLAHDLLNKREQKGEVAYYVSDDVDSFSTYATYFLGERVSTDKVTKIDIENY